MKSLLGLLRWIFRDFGPLIVFYATNRAFGFVPAIIASVVWSIVDVVLIKLKKQRVTPFLKFSIAVTVLFGIVDVYLKSPFLFRYEAVLTNVVTGVFFALTLRGDKTIIQEFAERRAEATGKTFPLTADTIHYFRLCSAVWAIYFFLKAAFYAWTGYRYDLERAVAIRIVVGNVTFYALMGMTTLLARFNILLLRRLRLAPSTRTPAPAPPPAPQPETTAAE